MNDTLILLQRPAHNLSKRFIVNIASFSWVPPGRQTTGESQQLVPRSISHFPALTGIDLWAQCHQTLRGTCQQWWHLVLGEGGQQDLHARGVFRQVARPIDALGKASVSSISCFDSAGTAHREGCWKLILAGSFFSGLSFPLPSSVMMLNWTRPQEQPVAVCQDTTARHIRSLSPMNISW